MGLAPKMLCGYRVLDITQFVAGPTCTRVLAEAGADVIKIELTTGYCSRFQGLKPRSPDREHVPKYVLFSTELFQEKSRTRFQTSKSRELLRKLVAKCDVVVENFTPGVMSRAGLGYEDLRKINPKIIMCSISFAGQSGPLSDKPGYDYIAQALAGITGVIGEPDGKPAQVPIAIGDGSTGVAAAMAVGFALLHRERTGKASLSKRPWSTPIFTCTRRTSPK